MQAPIGYKKTAVGIIPADWEVKRLSQIGELKNGINKDKDQFGFGFPLINLNDVFEINTDYDKEFSLVNSNEKERGFFSNTFFASSHDFLLRYIYPNLR